MYTIVANMHLNLAREYPQWVFADFASNDLHINNPSNGRLASLSVLRKWPVSMVTIFKITKLTKKYKKCNISVHI